MKPRASWGSGPSSSNCTLRKSRCKSATSSSEPAGAAPYSRAMRVRYALLILAVEDVERARCFYDAAFGWDVGVAVPVYVEYRVLPELGVGVYARDGFAVNTGAAPACVPHGATTATELYLRVDDLAEAERRLRAAGARLLSPAAPRDWGDVVAYYADPDGNVVAVAQVS